MIFIPSRLPSSFVPSSPAAASAACPSPWPGEPGDQERDGGECANGPGDDPRAPVLSGEPRQRPPCGDKSDDGADHDQPGIGMHFPRLCAENPYPVGGKTAENAAGYHPEADGDRARPLPTPDPRRLP